MTPLSLADRLNALLRRLPEAGVWCLGLIPLAWLIWQVLQGGPGVDPVRGIEHFLGKTGLWLLIACLVIPPLRLLTGINALRHRRAIGLLAFLYIVLHLTAWIWLEMGLYWSQALKDLWKRPYLFFGITAFLLLLPLAATSGRAAIRRLGPRWKQLHLLIWPAAGLAVLHYLWQMKIISREGWIWLTLFLALLVSRLISAGLRRKKLRCDSPRAGKSATDSPQGQAKLP